jgi:glycosyltransferase involved in cell wall biosynthesis
MSSPFVSVLLPCKNGASTILLAVNSILKQSYSNFELLLIDDGSTDRTIEIVKNINDERIKIISDGNSLGLAKRLNQGVALAKGVYIARMDADDVSFPSRLEEQISFLESNQNVHLVGCKSLAFNSDYEVFGFLPFQKDHPSLCNKIWSSIPLPHPTWLGRREWFTNNKYKVPDTYRAEDQELLLRAYQNSNYACLENVLFAYRVGQFQFSRSIKTRFSLFNAQLNYFVKTSKIHFILLSLLNLVIKIMFDVLSLFSIRKNYKSKFSKKNIKQIDLEQLSIILGQKIKL